jgi:hypothetical protein
MADHPHTIDRWDDTTGETSIEQIAAVGDYLVALETYRAAVQCWPNVKITLRNRARVIAWRLASPGLRSDESPSRIRNNANQYSWAIWVKRARCVAVLALRASSKQHSA